METGRTLWSLRDIDRLAQGFVTKRLPKEDWTHEAHLLVALWHLHHYSKDEATCLLRGRIIAYNMEVGVENTSKGGYHETLTLFWIWVVDHFLHTQAGTLPALATDFLQSKYANRKLPLLFYQRSTLFSVKARARWVEPDLLPLNFHAI